ncbi:MAG: lipopolysaccharide heptosyltransferase II [Victivallales bacterium]|nr:lipopolysaccharide heptosyltransferase II [Victivallales bacterium]
MPYSPIIQKFDRELPMLPPVDWRGGVVLRSTNWLGDLMMTLPATWQLKCALPADVPLWVFTPRQFAPIWKTAPWIDGVISFAEHHPSSLEIAEVKIHDFGLGIVLPNSFGSARDIWRCKIPRRLGRVGNFRSLMLTDRLPAWKRGEGEGKWHQLSFYLELMSVIGKISYTAEIPPLEVASEPAAAFGISKNAQWLAIAPGAAFGPAKQWPTENFAMVAREHIDHGGKVAIIGTAKEAYLAQQIQRIVPKTLDLTGKTGLDELMSVLQNVDGVIANDSGAMHLAAGLGTRGIALFASTDPVATGPLGAPWELLVATAECRPCFQRSCPWAGAIHYRCMRELTPQRVIELLPAILQRK